MLEDRFDERRRAAVMHVRGGGADTPQVLGQEGVRRVAIARIERDRRHVIAGNLVDRFGEPWAHHVALEIAKELDDSSAGAVPAQARPD